MGAWALLAVQRYGYQGKTIQHVEYPLPMVGAVPREHC